MSFGSGRFPSRRKISSRNIPRSRRIVPDAPACPLDSDFRTAHRTSSAFRKHFRYIPAPQTNISHGIFTRNPNRFFGIAFRFHKDKKCLDRSVHAVLHRIDIEHALRRRELCEAACAHHPFPNKCIPYRTQKFLLLSLDFDCFPGNPLLWKKSWGLRCFAAVTTLLSSIPT